MDNYDNTRFYKEYPGKQICNAMKAIRRKIAEANNIPFWTGECTYDGPCEGTCPKCDAEIRYLTDELKKKQERGEAYVIEGIGKTEIPDFPDNIEITFDDKDKKERKPDYPGGAQGFMQGPFDEFKEW